MSQIAFPIYRNFMTKKRLSNALIIGSIGAIIVFSATFFMAKEWLVRGKLVVFPSGLETAKKNLDFEVSNTAAIINNPDFQNLVFQDKIVNFQAAEKIKESSIVQIDFLARETEVASVKEIISFIPDEMTEYTKNIYGGAPYKYRLLESPEISTRPVKPNIIFLSFIGFIFGFLASLILSKRK